MSVIKINAITVPEGSGDELAQRFAARAGAVDDQTGFEGFELLKPTDGRNVWLVVTRWRDEDVVPGLGVLAGLRPRPPPGQRPGAPRWAGVLAQRAVVLRGEPHLSRTHLIRGNRLAGSAVPSPPRPTSRRAG